MTELNYNALLVELPITSVYSYCRIISAERKYI